MTSEPSVRVHKDPVDEMNFAPESTPDKEDPFEKEKPIPEESKQAPYMKMVDLK